MALKQLTVFVENKQGSVVPVTDALANHNINIRALSIAETEGYLIKITEVVGVKIGDAPGKLSAALKVLKEANINMEYLYAFMARTERHAYVVLRVENNAETEAVLEKAGLHIITYADVNKL